MPVADVVQITREHGLDLGLLASAVGSEKEAPSSIVGPRCGRIAHDNALPAYPGEKLAAGFAVPKAKLAMPCKKSEHSRLKMDYLARRADRIEQHQRSLLQQTGQARLCRQVRSIIVAEGRFCVAVCQSSVHPPPIRPMEASRPLTIR